MTFLSFYIYLLLILTFGGSTIQNFWAKVVCPLAAANRTIRELILFKSSYIWILYGMLVSLIF